jgi:hypothetical protein
MGDRVVLGGALLGVGGEGRKSRILRGEENVSTYGDGTMKPTKH